jgi:uncharacterized membrane protein
LSFEHFGLRIPRTHFILGGQSMSQQPVSNDASADDRLWAALGYPIGLVAIVMLLLDEKKNRPFIKYHAVQAIAANIAVWVIGFILSCLLAAATFFIGGLGAFLAMILWLVLLWPAYEAYNGKYLVIPVITDFIKKQGWV